MSRKQRRSARHDNKANRHIAPGDFSERSVSLENGTIKVGLEKPVGPFVTAQVEKVDDFDIQRLLELRHGGGKFKNIGLDEEVDLRTMTEENGGRPPQFLAMKKSTVQSFNAKLESAKEHMPRVDDIADRLMAATLERHDQAMQDIISMGKNPRLTRLGETGYHKAIQAWDDGSLIVPQMESLEGLTKVISRSATVFVVQHDWSSAFEKATDFADGEVLLPYDDVVFEFRISGRRVCCCIRGEESTAVACLLLVETSVGWALAGLYQITGGHWAYYQTGDDIVAPVLNMCRNQIRAVSIALEAEVVETELVRAPHRLNRKRVQAGKIPVFDHHIVHLAHRRRYGAREVLPTDIEDEHPGKRLHFVRSHIRHYTNHKVTIKWHLRGNPDLGFVDKEYRL